MRRIRGFEMGGLGANGPIWVVGVEVKKIAETLVK